jgi:hypothetical protein
MPENPLLYFILPMVALVIGFSKGGLGAALAVICTPLLALVMPVPQAISLTLPMLLIGDVFALYSFWRRWDVQQLRLLLPTATAGIIIGTYILATQSNQTLRTLVAVFILFFVVYKLVEPRLKNVVYQHANWHGYFAGAVAGVGSAIANVGGPPFTMYMLLQRDISPTAIAGTATLFFFIVNALKLPGLVAAGIFDLNDLYRAAWALPFIPIGVWIGRWGVARLNRARFDQIMLAVLTLCAVVMLLPPAR